MERETSNKEDALAQMGSTVLSKIETLNSSELDFVGQKFPELKPGSRGVVYLLLAVATLLPPVQAAWAAMGFLMVPYGFATANLAMALRLVAKGKNEEHQEWEKEQSETEEGEEGCVVDVPSEEVDEDDGAEEVDREPPKSQSNRGTRRKIDPAPEQPKDEPTKPFVANPWKANRPADAPLIQRPHRGELPNGTGSDELSEVETREAMDTFLGRKKKNPNPPRLEELLPLPVEERAKRLLDRLEEDGCDLWSYVDDPILVCQGTQQSGKSTLAVIVSILEAALYSKRINYITSNGDIYPVAFAAVGDGPEYYLQLTKYLSTLGKDQGGEDIWITDEISKQDYETTSSLWNQYLSDFVKTGDTTRIIAHGTSATDMGLPKGRASQSKKEITILAAKRKVDIVGKSKARALAKGGRYPSGQYQLQELQGENLVDVPGEQVQLPDWLLFDSYTHPRTAEKIPCYVRSLLRYFPELDTRADGSEPRVLFEETAETENEREVEPPPSDTHRLKVADNLESLLSAVDENHDPLTDVSELAQKLYTWITTGAGTKLWEQRETKTATLTIIDRESIISKGNRHRVEGSVKNFHSFELADAISELVSVRKISKTREGHVVVKTVWKDREV